MQRYRSLTDACILSLRCAIITSFSSEREHAMSYTHVHDLVRGHTWDKLQRACLDASMRAYNNTMSNECQLQHACIPTVANPAAALGTAGFQQVPVLGNVSTFACASTWRHQCAMLGMCMHVLTFASDILTGRDLHWIRLSCTTADDQSTYSHTRFAMYLYRAS